MNLGKEIKKKKEEKMGKSRRRQQRKTHRKEKWMIAKALERRG